MTASSPRTNLSEKLKLEKQIAKLEEMKQEALAKLVGLNKFQMMTISKQKMSDELSEEQLMAELKKQFGVCLPLKYFNLVLVCDVKEDKVLSDKGEEEEKPNSAE